jgi:hypothetical protein
MVAGAACVQELPSTSKEQLREAVIPQSSNNGQANIVDPLRVVVCGSCVRNFKRIALMQHEVDCVVVVEIRHHERQSCGSISYGQ